MQESAFTILARLVVDGPPRTSTLAHVVYAEISTVSRQSAQLLAGGDGAGLESQVIEPSTALLDRLNTHLVIHDLEETVT